MKLQLTVFAEDLGPALSTPVEEGCHPFAVVALVVQQQQQQQKPSSSSSSSSSIVVLGKTEVLRNTLDPDFTKIFILNDFELGKPMQVMVTLHDAKHGNRKISASSSVVIVFDVGAVLGTKGGVMGKQIHPNGGYVMVHVERTSGLGTLNLKLRALDLQSAQEQVDPYFELQKRRKTSSGKTIWDVVFRSMPVEDTKDPSWSEVYIDLGLLCGGKKKQKFRISVKDYDDNDDTLIGSCFVTVKDLLLLAASTDAGDDGDENAILMNTEKAMIPLMRPRPLREVGKLLVVSASIGDAAPVEEDIVFEEEEEEGESTPRSAAPGEEPDEDIVLEPTDDIEILPEDLDGGAHFADYISGGCQLRVIVAIDYTASNGDPRKEDSLHSFKKDGTSMNMYEQTISKICTILSEYDSDQKFPVYGFGAKKGRGSPVSHCFPVVVGDDDDAGDDTAKEVEGVEGILAAYKGAFQSGIAMSKPTNITEVIKRAGEDAKESLKDAIGKGSQVYSILTIFTNGNVHSVEETIAALDSVQDAPLSVVVVGVGPSDFADMAFLNEQQCQPNKDGGNKRRVHFVDTKLHPQDQALTEKTLSIIPEQLVSYFSSRGIRPNPPVEPDEIVIEPFGGGGEGESGGGPGGGAQQADIVVSQNGDISVQEPSGGAAPPPSGIAAVLPAQLAAMGGKGKTKILAQAKRQFGKVSQHLERNLNRMIDQRVNKMFGISNVTSGGKKKRQAK